jgi:TonB-linked SusC/RagA family outer membrane protein
VLVVGTSHAQASTVASGHGADSSAAATASPSDAPLRRLVTLELTDVPLASALRMIDRQADLGLAFTNEVVPAKKRVSISVKGIPAEDALKRVLEGTGIVVRQTASGQLILVKPASARIIVPRDTSGFAAIVVHVTDSVTSQELVGAVVTVKGTGMTANTADQGFALFRDVPSGLRVVTVRYLGFAPAEQRVVVPDSAYVRVEFKLRMGMTRLQEMVTTATGTTRRYELGNDITILNVDSIVATQPISSVTDLLEGRVPGLTVRHTSGAPGDPSRLRLRGTSSVLRNNDPIVIVDGIRVYSAQSDSTSANLASGRGSFGGSNLIAAPSPLDQLDPQSIETIEVMKGPSAATLYGPDAANGVIVITTKRGRAGPARWTASTTRGISNIPGRWADGLYRWGTNRMTYTPVLCTLTDFTCREDSLVSFQALNNSRYTVLGQGANTSASLGVSGGSDALAYAITGSYDTQTGLLTLPSVEATRFELEQGTPAPSWMQTPQQLRRWSATSRLTAKINDRTDASLTSTLTRESQQRSDLEGQLTSLMSTYIDPTTGTYWRGNGSSFSTTRELLPGFYTRSTDAASNFTNGANITFRPRSWLTTSADAGLNVISRQDEVLLPSNFLVTDSAGALNEGHGSTVVSSANLRGTATAPLPWGFHLEFAAGANYTTTSLATLSTGVTGLQPGTGSVNGAGHLVFASQYSSDITSFGWYVEPTFKHQRFTLSTGMRIDGSSTFGAKANLPLFPKVGGSWLISEEPFFPFKNFFDVFRLRAAYGRAGVWPGPADQLRLYSSLRPWLDGSFTDATQVTTIGNSQLRPERSSEMEGGFDTDILTDRISIGLTGYRKMRYDALLPVPVAPSVYGSNVFQLKNIGVIRNTGLELSLSTQLVRTDPITWSTSFSLGQNHNEVTQLAPGVLPFGTNDARVVPGYPLFGRWARPILGYSDTNGDGVIERSEVLLGDSLIYMGASEPKYEANLFTTLSLLRGMFTVDAGFAYQNGLTQLNATIGGPQGTIFSPGLSDPKSSFGEQAAVAVMTETSYGILQTVNTFRFNTLSVAFNAPPTVANRFGATSLSVALQGTNLGLHTNYRGKDPNVNANAVGNGTIDTGVLPVPRSWQLNIHATY